MIIAFASGKGGTGKTSVSVAFAQAYPDNIAFLDCDVEEPNAHFFIKPEKLTIKTVNVPVPGIESSKCTACGTCSKVCQFNAIIQIRKKVTIFQDLCHSCGGCVLFCPAKAISELPSEIGTIATGQKNHITFAKGELLIGKAMSPPIIRKLKQLNLPIDDIIIDSPPGTACPMVTAVKGADYVVLVTEPTPFGLNDLKLAVNTVKELQIPFGVVINRSADSDTLIEKYCDNEQISLLLKIPEDREIAKAYSVGKSMLDVKPDLKDIFSTLITKVQNQIRSQ